MALSAWQRSPGTGSAAVVYASLSAVASGRLLRKALSYEVEGLLGRHGCPADTLDHALRSDLDAAVLGVEQFTDPPIDAQLG
jgi:hypothetical protein